jgi:hypothetical protein
LPARRCAVGSMSSTRLMWALISMLRGMLVVL